MAYKKAIQKGVRIEAEHGSTYEKLKRHIKETGKLPPKKKFYSMISSDHIKELGVKYYPNLIKMEKELKKSRGKR